MTVGPSIAIIGGGAIGVALFSLLAERLAPKASSRNKPRIVLFEKSERVGRGLAYANDPSPYLLNQSAQTMSLVPGRRDDFFEWLQRSGLSPSAAGEYFCERRIFGDYIEEHFVRARENARRRGISTSIVNGEVTALTSRASGGYRVSASGHPPVDTDIAILAVGNLPSKKFASLAGPNYFASPYPSTAFRERIAKDARVAILGTGLSAIDAAIALVANGHEGPIVMASRRGLLPTVRGPLPDHTLTHVTHANIANATEHGRRPLRWSTVLRLIEREFEEHAQSISWDRDFPASIDPESHLSSEVEAASNGARLWQSIGEALNPLIEVIWNALADDDRRIFLDQYRSRFISHWVPIPLVTARRLLALLRAKKVRVLAGLVETTLVREKNSDRYSLRFEDDPIDADVVINATGAPRDLDECDSRLLDALRERGTIAPHPSGGIRVDFESLRVIGEDGRADPSLFAIGNLTNGTHLFTSTLDLNVEKAARVAAHVADELDRRIDKTRHVHAPPHSS